MNELLPHYYQYRKYLLENIKEICEENNINQEKYKPIMRSSAVI